MAEVQKSVNILHVQRNYQPVFVIIWLYVWYIFGTLCAFSSSVNVEGQPLLWYRPQIHYSSVWHDN